MLGNTNHMNIERLDKEIIDLSAKLNKLKQQRDKIKIEQADIWAGSVIKCWNNYDCYEEDVYKIVLVYLQHIPKYGLLDTSLNIIWKHMLFDSIEDVKNMIKNDISGNWEIISV